MKTSTIILAAAGLAAAKPEFTNSSFDVVQGKPFEITYSGCDSGCTITIENGPSGNLTPVDTIAPDATGSSVTFTPTGLPTDTYAFRIVDNSSGDQNFSQQFQVQGNGPPASSASASATASSSEVMSTITSAVKTTTTAETTPVETLTTPEESSTMTTVVSSTESKTSTVKTTITSAFETPNPTPSASSTSSQSSSAAATTPGSAGAPTVPDSLGNHLASPMALIACAVGAMLFFN